MSKLEIRYIPMAVSEVRLNDSEDGNSVILDGHAAVFNSLSEDLGGFRERVIPGAFTKTLLANPDVRALINHDGLPLGRTKSKTLALSQDSRGLAFSLRMNKNDPDAMRVIPKIQRGDVDQMSFGFRCVTDNWLRDQDNQDIRELRECDIHSGDVSIVTYPAYPSANVAMRSMNEIQSLEEVRAAHRDFITRIEMEARKSGGMSRDHARRVMAMLED